MKQLNLFIELTRLKRPIGFMLLFWPCAWGLTLAYNFSNNLNNYFFYLTLFFLGSILMRSAGCIVNDISDKEFDKKVERTKNRPIASNKVPIKLAIFYTILLCSIAFLILINFNNLTIILALGSMPLAFAYPLMKRFTYWPQLFLGITFNYGLILGWTSIVGEINLIPIIFYLGAIFWTLGYDTIYGFQDIKDDEIIGVKSTSIKFKKKPKQFIFLCYLIFISSLTIVGFFMNFSYLFYFFSIIATIQLIFFQIYKLNFKNPKNCLYIFKSNNFLGLLVFFSILVGRLSIQ
jgi:4-hydroxybenzoate polyprenyltransferase